jgi:membrane associated rhomboid family serine protease
MADMSENRDEPPGTIRRYRLSRSATLVILVANVAVFLLQKSLLPRLLPQSYLQFSLEGLSRGFLWQLMTYQFLHASLLHILLNCWMLFVFGQHVEKALGTTRFVALYFGSGIAGGLLHAFAAFVWPNYFNASVVGASAGVFGVVSAFAILWPDHVFLFYFLPIKLRARSLLLINLILTALGIAFPTSFLGGNVAHVAHLGGILMGLAFTRWVEGKLPPSE